MRLEIEKWMRIMVTSNGQLASYLQPLLHPTPSSVAKLLAAWDGLTTESQIQLLTLLPSAQHPAYLADNIWHRAMKSENSYVRYLGCRSFRPNPKNASDLALKARIDLDPDPLVRYSPNESTFVLGLEDADVFMKLPHEARLAKVRCLEGFGEEIAKIISHAISNQLSDGRVSEMELCEILWDYLLKPSFHKQFNEDRFGIDDGHGEYLAGRDLEALWRLVPLSPENVTYVLLQTLPAETSVAKIPSDVVEALSDKQLQWLLYRSGVAMRDLRQKLYWNGTKKGDDVVRAAVHYHFSLGDQGVGILLAAPPEDCVDAIEFLANNARELRLCE